MKKISFILLSGGIGQRMKLNTPKQFLLLGGKPIIIHTLEKIDIISEIQEIIIPSPSEFLEETERVISQYSFTKPISCIEGGSTRQESVLKGLIKAQYNTVLIHEAVRPFVKKNEFLKMIENPHENVVYGIDIPFTVLEGKGKIEKNLKRENLINIQLPQKYNKHQLLGAHYQAAKEGLTFTEDASLLFHYSKADIQVMEGTEYNIKITKPIDRKIAEIIYKDYILGED